MLHGPMLHPELIGALGRAGHGSRILIGDGNYPSMNGVNPAAERVYLNLAPGLLTVSQILDVVKETIPIEQVALMVPAEDAVGIAVLEARERALRRGARQFDRCGGIGSGRLRRIGIFGERIGNG